MPFLWNTLMKLLTMLKRPSPKHRKHSFFKYFIEKASLFISPEKKLDAGMTVEASIVLPLFLFFFVNLGSIMEMMRLHGRLQLALWDVGNRMCVYGYAAGSRNNVPDTADGVESEKEDRGWLRELGDIALSYTYVKSQVTDYVGEAYLEESPLSHGVSGLQFWESDAAGGGDLAVGGNILDIVMTYQVAPKLEIPFVRPFRMSNRYYGRLWTGYDLTEGVSEQDEPQDVVYITDNASVYHESRECTHLALSIREVSLGEAMKARNKNGGRYVECLKCRKKPFQGTVFIGSDGDCYHYDRGCSGLKRTIYTISRQQAAKYRPCSRCAAVP